MLAALLLAAATTSWADDKPESMILHRSGALPIIVTAPHGGRLKPPGVSEPRQGKDASKFTTVRDERTDAFAERLADAIEKELGARPYLVVAKFDRKYIDANRPAKDAFESPEAKPVYEAYHKEIRDACSEIQKKWGRGMLLDIHGQGVNSKAVIRGTNDLKSVRHLIEHSGRAALVGPRSIFGQLAKQGWEIVPPNDSTDNEDRRLNGGYTVQTYGSNHGGAFDAIQFELGGTFRTKANLDKSTTELAKAVAVFAKEYLPLKPAKAGKQPAAPASEAAPEKRTSG